MQVVDCVDCVHAVLLIRRGYGKDDATDIVEYWNGGDRTQSVRDLTDLQKQRSAIEECNSG